VITSVRTSKPHSNERAISFVTERSFLPHQSFVMLRRVSYRSDDRHESEPAPRNVATGVAPSHRSRPQRARVAVHGGTSLAAPLVSAIVADCERSAGARIEGSGECSILRSLHRNTSGYFTTTSKDAIATGSGSPRMSALITSIAQNSSRQPARVVNSAMMARAASSTATSKSRSLRSSDMTPMSATGVPRIAERRRRDGTRSRQAAAHQEERHAGGRHALAAGRSIEEPRRVPVARDDDCDRAAYERGPVGRVANDARLASRDRRQRFTRCEPPERLDILRAEPQCFGCPSEERERRLSHVARFELDVPLP